MFWKLAMVAAMAGLAFAQADRGTLTGTVLDPQGAVILDAKVELRNQQNGAVFATVSTATGNYSLVQVPAGPYTLTVESVGFKMYSQAGITIQVAQTTRLDVSLVVGATTETVSVTAESTLLKT